MAQLNSLLVSGASRFLQKAYFNDGLSVSGGMVTDTITTKGNILVNGTVVANGILNVGSGTAGNAIIYLNSKEAIRGFDQWLRINDVNKFTSGVYFGGGVVRLDGTLQIGGSGEKVKITQSTANFTIPTTFTNLVQTNNLTVSDTLIATKYQISTIQTLGGAFDVCPDFITNASATATISSSTGSISFGLEPDGKATITVTGYYIITIKDASITSSSMCGATWTANSKVKINGIINGVSYRSVTGYMQYNLNNTANTINIIVPKANIAGTIASGSNLKAANVSIILTHLYKSVNGATARRYPIGMFMTSHNENRGTGISMYDGAREKPGLVLGNLDMAGLDKVGGYAPTGWGLYATNAYLQGTIVASTGKIGGWNLTASSLWSGNSAFKNENGMYFGSEGISIKDKFYVDKDGALTSTSGTISKWNIDSTYLQSSDKTVGLSATATDWAFWAGGASTSSAKFRVNHTGKLWASDAEIAGNINAKTGTIGGFTILAKSLSIGTLGEANSVFMSTGTTDKADIAGSGSIANWVFTAGSTFGVTKAGKIYSTSGNIGGFTITSNSLWSGNSAYDNANSMYFGASGISIKDKFKVSSAGAMTSTSGTIGGWTITDNSLYRTNSAFKNANGMYFGTSGISIKNKFYVNSAGAMTATSGTIGNVSIKDDGSMEVGNSYGLLILGMNAYTAIQFGKNGSGLSSLNYDGGALFTGAVGVSGKLTCGKGVMITGAIDNTGNITCGGDILLGNVIGFGFNSEKNNAIYREWKDGQNHDIVVATTDLLSTAIGWIGSSTYKTSLNLRGQSIKCNGSTSWSSDRNLKHSIYDIDNSYEKFFYSLRPVTYQYDLGGSQRHHVGYIAQEVEQALYDSGLTTKDFAGFVQFDLSREKETNENGDEVDIENSDANYLLDKGINKQCNLAYTEFIALNTHMIQKQYVYIQELQRNLAFMKQQLQSALDQIQLMKNS